LKAEKARQERDWSIIDEEESLMTPTPGTTSSAGKHLGLEEKED
jgi:hypothetical protein